MIQLQESTPSERAAAITYQLCQGASFTLAEIAQHSGITKPNAYKMMLKISRAVPATTDDKGRWYIPQDDENQISRY